MVSDWIWISLGTVVAKPPLRVVHVIWLTVNVRPSGTVAEAGIVTILFAGKVARTPPTWRAGELLAELLLLLSEARHLLLQVCVNHKLVSKANYTSTRSCLERVTNLLAARTGRPNDE